MKVTLIFAKAINIIAFILCAGFVALFGVDHISIDLLAILIISSVVLVSSSLLLGKLRKHIHIIIMLSINLVMATFTLVLFIALMGDDLAEFTGWFMVFGLPYFINTVLFYLNKSRAIPNI